MHCLVVIDSASENWPRMQTVRIHTRPSMEDLATEADSLMTHSLATNTWKTYKTTANSLLRFRREYGFPDSWPVPLDQFCRLLIVYAGYPPPLLQLKFREYVTPIKLDQ